MTTPPITSGNLADLVRDAAERFGDRIALIGSFGSRTWRELDAAVDTAAADLVESGVHRGDRVLVALPSSADLAVALLAVARAGLVAVPIDPDAIAPEVVAGRMQAAIAIAGSPVGVVHEFGPVDLDGWWSRSRAPVAGIGGGEDLAVLARASRSERAVMIPHRAVLAAVDAICATPRLDLRADDRALMAMPFYHLAGFVTGFLPLATVGAAAVLPGTGAGSWVSAVREHRVTILPGSPTVYREVLQTAGAERALASVRLMTSGAASLLAEDFAAMRSLTGQDVWEGYGISEATAVIASSLMTPKARAGSVGLPVPGLEVRIGSDSPSDSPSESPSDTPDDADPAGDEVVTVDAGAGAGDAGGSAGPGSRDDDPGNSDTAIDTADAEADAGGGVPDGVPPVEELSAAEEADNNLIDIGSAGEVGPIEVRGPTLFGGYWPDASGGPGPDGWYTTADLGYVDDAGELRLVDRSVDTFVVSGFTVYPREIERVLADHPQVAESAVIGVGGQDGTTTVAVIVARPGSRPTDDDLSEFVADRLPEFKRPTVFRWVDALPRTELGRIDRSVVLASVAAAGDLGPSANRPVVAVPPAEPDRPGDTDGRADSEQNVEQEGPDLTPERAAGLDELGKRLPGAGSRGARSSQDSDDDLFGEDYS